eukprot:Rhum_TRINITY_DN162_c0_g2::Rhum_TRINITY_DN162_c0_g2_i1::g.475::m.475/K07921/RAB34; Ras-related protein Rab-34
MTKEAEVVHSFVPYGGQGFDHSGGRCTLGPEAESRREAVAADVRACCEGSAREAKVLVVGEAGAGKTSFLRRAAAGVFDTNYKLTIGVDFEFFLYKVFDIPVKIVAWDTAGQEKFRAVSRNFYTGAEAVLIFYDTHDVQSFRKVFTHWLPEIRDALDTRSGGGPSTVPIFLVGNKTDLASFVDDSEVAALAAEHKLEWYKASVMDDCLHNTDAAARRVPVKRLFDRVASVLVEAWLAADAREAAAQGKGAGAKEGSGATASASARVAGLGRAPAPTALPEKVNLSSPAGAKGGGGGGLKGLQSKCC